MDGALTGSLIDGRYRVGPIVGAGGFGTVYAAVHVGLVGQVALKIPRVDDLAPQDASRLVATFLEEGRLLKRLRHPNVVSALDVGLLPADATGRSLPYLVLEWCDGVTLKDWLTGRGPLSPDAAWALLRPAFEAIGHAHEHGIAHRDVKPANILLERQRGALVPRIIDFGIAKLVEPKVSDGSGQTRTTSDRPAYTPRYAAPEQLLGLRSGPPSDVFALALVLLETLLGRSVFESNDAARAAIADGDLPTPAKLGLHLGPWNEVLERALAWRAADRYADAHALVRALDDPSAAEARPSAPPRPPSSTRPPSISTAREVTPGRSRAEAISVTARTSGPRNMAHAMVEVGGLQVFLALHTRRAPSDAEWRSWTELLEEKTKAAQWQLAGMPNLVLTDGGAPNTAQRTTVNVFIAQARSLPPVAIVTSSPVVRVMVRAFSIFNARIRVFAPADVAAAIAHLGLDRVHLPEILARCARLEADVLGAGAVETLGAVTRVRT